MTILFHIFNFLLVVGLAYLWWSVGKSKGIELGKKQVKERGLGKICAIISNTKNHQELEKALEIVSQISSALINLKLISVWEVADFTTAHIVNQVKTFQDDKCRAEMPSRKLVEDIIHTKKKGITRKVVRDKKGHFVKKPHSKSEGRRLSIMKKSK